MKREELLSTAVRGSQNIEQGKQNVHAEIRILFIHQRHAVTVSVLITSAIPAAVAHNQSLHNMQ